MESQLYQVTFPIHLSLLAQTPSNVEQEHSLFGFVVHQESDSQ